MLVQAKTKQAGSDARGCAERAGSASHMRLAVRPASGDHVRRKGASIAVELGTLVEQAASGRELAGEDEPEAVTESGGMRQGLSCAVGAPAHGAGG